MPVNLLPIIVPLLLGWIVCTGLLFRWRLLAGASFLGLSLAALILIGANTNIEHKIDEEMPYRIVGSGRGEFVEFTTSRGELVTDGSGNIISALEALSEPTAHVTMNAWFDFGRLRAYQIITVEGRRPVYLPRSNGEE